MRLNKSRSQLRTLRKAIGIRSKNWFQGEINISARNAGFSSRRKREQKLAGLLKKPPFWPWLPNKSVLKSLAKKVKILRKDNYLENGPESQKFSIKMCQKIANAGLASAERGGSMWLIRVWGVKNGQPRRKFKFWISGYSLEVSGTR